MNLKHELVEGHQISQHSATKSVIKELNFEIN